MQQISRTWSRACRFAVVALIASSPVHPALAQSVEDLDQLVQASGSVEDGLELARSQVNAGSFLEALATLERIMPLAPKNKQVRLRHASILCMIDDRTGASVEFGRLKAKDYPKAQWAAANAPCQTNPAAGEPSS